MTAHFLRIVDGTDATEKVQRAQHIERAAYTVLRSLRKNGVDYEPGHVILLDPHTANNFKRNGDIE